MDIKYTITMHSYWHCGSGLAAGSDVDALVVKDSNGLPFVPGKTMKGLVKEAVEEAVEALEKNFRAALQEKDVALQKAAEEKRNTVLNLMGLNFSVEKIAKIVNLSPEEVSALISK